MGIDVAEKPVSIESERTDFQIRLNRNELPWLPDQHHDVSLVKMETATGKFLFGSAIQGKNLTEAASQLDQHRSQIANNLLYTHLGEFAQGYNPHVKVVEDAITNKPIFYVGNKGGQRVYFMRFGKVDNMPVIIKIAACDKAEQLKVLKTITTNSQKRLKAAYGVT